MNFADSGAILALFFENDQNHKEANRLWPTLARPVITSNLMVAELAEAVARRRGSWWAADRIAGLYASPSYEVIAYTREDEIQALSWMRKYADQKIGFIDCVSFALMRRHGIRTAFTFDRHFRTVGFHVIGLK
jgi:predicted nucleic acid-binding protein